jgi:AbiV family abortive infection protein
MQNLSLQTICDGIVRVRNNASELLEDAKLLRQNGRISRAYALAYMACEEAGKLSILIGAATQIALGVPVDWKTRRKRFRSHDSKASQFMALAKAIPIIQEAAAAGRKTVDIDEVMIKSAVGVVFGPTLFATRNAAIYCDFVDGSFTSPSEQIKETMADQMIEYAGNHVLVANMVLGKSAEEAATSITASASQERYDNMMSLAAEMAQTVHSALRKDK